MTLVETPSGKFCRSLETLLDCPKAMLAVNRMITTKSNSREPQTAPLGSSVVITFFSLLYEGIKELLNCFTTAGGHMTKCLTGRLSRSTSGSNRRERSTGSFGGTYENPQKIGMGTICPGCRLHNDGSGDKVFVPAKLLSQNAARQIVASGDESPVQTSTEASDCELELCRR